MMVLAAVLCDVSPLLARQSRVVDPLHHAATRAAGSAVRNGAAHVAAGRWDEARQAFVQAIRFDPELVPAHYNLGVTLGVLGRHDEAIAAYRQALKLAPSLTDALVNIGVELFQLNRRDEAMKTLQRAVQVAPENPAAHHNLGVVLASAGRLDEAVVALERATTLAPADGRSRRALADTHYNLGVMRAGRRQWTTALDSYAKAIAANRELPEAFNGAGVALMRLRHATLALAMFDEALRLRPSFTAAHYHRARSLAALERHDEAIASCRAALLVQPHFREALWLLDSLLRLIAPAARATQID